MLNKSRFREREREGRTLRSSSVALHRESGHASHRACRLLCIVTWSYVKKHERFSFFFFFFLVFDAHVRARHSGRFIMHNIHLLARGREKKGSSIRYAYKRRVPKRKRESAYLPRRRWGKKKKRRMTVMRERKGTNKQNTKKRTVVVVSAMLRQAKQSFKIISTKFDCKYPFKIRAPV